MLEKAKIEALVKNELEENMFIVDVMVTPSNIIRVYIDSFDGLTIDQCVSISRNIEKHLDREAEDFELQVSSPGLSEGFKVKAQYLKNLGREVEVVMHDNTRLEGVLEEADEEGIALKTASRQKVEGHKKKQLVEKKHLLNYGEIKSAKEVISFKKRVSDGKY